MGNCIRKQREKELAKRAMKREELVRYFLGGDDTGHYATAGNGTGGKTSELTGHEVGGVSGAKVQEALSGVSTPQEALNETATEMQPAKRTVSSAVETLGSVTFTTAAAAAIAVAAKEAAAEESVEAEDPESGWRLTDRRREAALYAMENDGIDRLHDNAELQLEQRRERQRRDERLLAIVGGLASGGGGGGGGGGSGFSMLDDGDGRMAGNSNTSANAYSYNGGPGSSGHAAVSYHGNRHVSFGCLDNNKPGTYRK